MEKVEEREVMVVTVSVLSFFLAWEESSSICVKKNFSDISSLSGKKGGKKAATSKELSDMDYLKSKVVEDSSSSSSAEEETESEEEEESETEEDSGIAETHPEKRGKPKAQQTEQVGKKKKGSTLEVQLNQVSVFLKQQLYG